MSLSSSAIPRPGQAVLADLLPGERVRDLALVVAYAGFTGLAAQLVVPLLQVGAGPHPGTPVSPPQLAWEQVAIIYGVFGVALLITLLALAGTLGRMKLFQAVKLGDAN